MTEEPALVVSVVLTVIVYDIVSEENVGWQADRSVKDELSVSLTWL